MQPQKMFISVVFNSEAQIKIWSKYLYGLFNSEANNKDGPKFLFENDCKKQ